MKRPRSFGALPFARTKVEGERGDSGNIAANSLKLSATEVSQVCEILENGDLAEKKERERQPKEDEKHRVIRSISQATQLDEDSVCRIIEYFSELTTKDQTESNVGGFDKIEVALQAQKVGAN